MRRHRHDEDSDEGITVSATTVSAAAAAGRRWNRWGRGGCGEGETGSSGQSADRGTDTVDIMRSAAGRDVTTSTRHNASPTIRPPTSLNVTARRTLRHQLRHTSALIRQFAYAFTTRSE